MLSFNSFFEEVYLRKRQIIPTNRWGLFDAYLEDSHLSALFAERVNAVLGPVAEALQETFRHTVPGLSAGEDPQWTGFPDEKNREGGKSDDDPGDKA